MWCITVPLGLLTAFMLKLPVLTKDIPANVIAFGSPCKVYREINEHDEEYYFKDRRFDDQPEINVWRIRENGYDKQTAPGCRHGRIFWSGWNFRPKGREDMFADYHVHTEFSDDSVYPMEKVVRDAIAGGMDEICFTDHVDYGVKQDWN